MATAASTVDKAPVYSKAVLKILGASREFCTPTEVIAHMEGSVFDDWRKEWPDGFRMASPVELRGVCCKVLCWGGGNNVKLEIVEAQNTVVPAQGRLNATTQVLTLDGATVEPSKFQSSAYNGLPAGTLLYAKRIIAYYQCTPDEGYRSTGHELTWDFVIAKFLTLDQLSKIEDWTSLP